MRRRFANNHKTFDYSKYMTIEALEDGYVTYFTRDVEYNLNGHKWVRLEVGLLSPILKKGDLLSIRCSLAPNERFGRFCGNHKAINLRGNILSLIFKDDINLDISQYPYVFDSTFIYNSGNNIVSVEKNFLPATILADSCYNCMFYGCTNLITAPELPATILADSCYNCMFYGTNVLPDCSNIDFSSNIIVSSGGLKGLFAGTKVADADLLNILPINSSTGKYWLPVTKLADSCYGGMFYNCTSLTTAPELPATTLDYMCYSDMFYGCTNLTTAPELPATTLDYMCYSDMFYGCTNLTTAPELPATTLAKSCYNYMFYKCTSLTTAPELPATTLASYCYNSMFQDCSSLTVAPELPATTLVYSCYYNMFRGCTSLTSAPELPATKLDSNCYLNMFSNCSKLNYIKMLATDISATYCLSNWVSGVSSTGTFVKNKNATWNVTGNSGVPSGWTIQKV